MMVILIILHSTFSRGQQGYINNRASTHSRDRDRVGLWVR